MYSKSKLDRMNHAGLDSIMASLGKSGFEGTKKDKMTYILEHQEDTPQETATLFDNAVNEMMTQREQATALKDAFSEMVAQREQAAALANFPEPLRTVSMDDASDEDKEDTSVDESLAQKGLDAVLAERERRVAIHEGGRVEVDAIDRIIMEREGVRTDYIPMTVEEIIKSRTK